MGIFLLSQVITAQLFSIRASNADDVMVIRLLSSSTTPMSSIGIVRLLCFLKLSGRSSHVSTSGKRIANCAFCKLK